MRSGPRCKGSNERGAEAGIWLARLSAELKSEADLTANSQDDLAVYLNADADTLSACALDAWHDNMSLSKAIENADVLQQHLLLLELPGGGSFPKPAGLPIRWSSTIRRGGSIAFATQRRCRLKRGG